MILRRVVLDTNVVASALIFDQGRVSWLLNAWQKRVFRPLASLMAIEELRNVLAKRKFNVAPARQVAMLKSYCPWCDIFEVPDSIEVPACRGAPDRHFLALSIISEADALITGDRELQGLAGSFSVPILSPAEFGARLIDQA